MTEKLSGLYFQARSVFVGYRGPWFSQTKCTSLLTGRGRHPDIWDNCYKGMITATKVHSKVKLYMMKSCCNDN